MLYLDKTETFYMFLKTTAVALQKIKLDLTNFAIFTEYMWAIANVTCRARTWSITRTANIFQNHQTSCMHAERGHVIIAVPEMSEVVMNYSAFNQRHALYAIQLLLDKWHM